MQARSLRARLVIFLLALISDFLDGYIARKYKMGTFFGGLLDPVADRAFLAFVLMSLAIENVISAWLLLLFFFRDALLFMHVMLWLFALNKVPPRFSSFFFGKILTVFQFLIVLMLILSYDVRWTVVPQVIISLLVFLEACLCIN